jgi:putative transposase
MGTYGHSPLTDKGYPRRPGTKVHGGGVSVVVRGRESRPQGEGGQVSDTRLKPEERSVDSDLHTDTVWLLGVQRKLYQWSQDHPGSATSGVGCNILTSPSLLESRMHSERCMSGSARGRAKPLVARPEWRACPTQPYIRLSRGFVYLVAIIDWYSRRVLAWRISNSLDTAFCVDCLEDALSLVGKPDIFNSDQGAQFTSAAFTGVLKREGVAISMDGRGRALDNIFVERLWRSVKYEDVYLKGYGTVTELTLGLAEYFAFYNGERPHQSLDNRTPITVHADGQGGGASIPDHVGVTTGQRCSAAIETMGVV